MKHIEVSRKGGQSKSQAKMEAMLINLAKARKSKMEKKLNLEKSKALEKQDQPLIWLVKFSAD